MPAGNPLAYLLPAMMGAGASSDPFANPYAFADDPLESALRRQREMLGEPQPLPPAPANAQRAGLAGRNAAARDLRADPLAGVDEAREFAQGLIADQGRFGGMAGVRGINPHSGQPSPASLERLLAAQGLGEPPPIRPGGGGGGGPRPSMSFSEWEQARSEGWRPAEGGLNSVGDSESARIAFQNKKARRQAGSLSPLQLANAPADVQQARARQDNRQQFFANRREGVQSGLTGGDQPGGLGQLLSPQALSFIPPHQRAQYVSSIAGVVGESQQRSQDRIQQLKIAEMEAKMRGDLQTAQQVHEQQMAEAERSQKLALFQQEMELKMEELAGQREQMAAELGLNRERNQLSREQFEFSKSPQGITGSLVGVGADIDTAQDVAYMGPDAQGGSRVPSPRRIAEQIEREKQSRQSLEADPEFRGRTMKELLAFEPDNLSDSDIAAWTPQLVIAEARRLIQEGPKGPDEYDHLWKLDRIYRRLTGKPMPSQQPGVSTKEGLQMIGRNDVPMW